ncbi:MULTISPECIES: light-harvesting antenna LH1, beta subunit [Niveispirillum]|uniref:Light-harvesting protein n=2 Tax=Niveispirillum TaxID=1543704 RepID=A0A255YYL5_9PROT|nr:MULTISPECIES: light-harvesting antenna LH1, beta subunit [Niveispirillum]AUN32308.1 light-harvesting protein [Niveispirillum cyanobacteriorum]OYQ34261.1 light-harvesting protein [Niveispirillum lacus]GGE76206.1 light-harvesting protein B-870 beta chain [Niveispirillum cyanobacteriorum]
MADSSNVSLSGLTESEAREVHSFFIQGFLIFTVIAIAAHVLVWMWRPWIPGPNGYASLEGIGQTAQSLLPMIG